MKICPTCRAQYPPGVKFCPADGQSLEGAEEGHTSEEDRFLGALLDERYRIEENRLGEGGMGVVYAARHEVIDKPVAVKILRHEYCRDKGLVQRFIREARAASRIGHPNIVDVTDFGKLPDGHIYFVMEYLKGTTLGRVMKERGVLPLARVMDLAVQICHGLAAAHAKGIVHRDLKPENIFIVNPASEGVGGVDETGTRSDFIKLLDFGIAKFNFGQKTRLTRMGSVFGTPQYMSPEQAAGEDADHRGDIYAFGCILYEMVTGQVPFVADTFMGTLTKHMFEAPIRPGRMRPELGIPNPLENIILKMLAKEPSLRFDSTVAVATALREILPTIEGCEVLLVPDDMMETYPPGDTRLDLRSSGTEIDMAPPGAMAAVEDAPQDDVAARDVVLLERRKEAPLEPLERGVEEIRVARSRATWAVGAALLVAMVGGGFWLSTRRGGGGASPQDSRLVAKEASVPASKSAADGAASARTPDAGAATRVGSPAAKAASPKPSPRRYSRVRIDSVPGGAFVRVKGRTVDKQTPVVITIPRAGAGRVRVTVFKAGFRDKKLSIDGRRRAIKVRLSPGGPLRTPKPGQGW